MWNFVVGKLKESFIQMVLSCRIETPITILNKNHIIQQSCPVEENRDNVKIKITKNKNDLSSLDILNFEEKYGIELPKEYADFLLKCNGGKIEDNLFIFPDEDGDSYETSIQYFLPLMGNLDNDLESYFDYFENVIPYGLFPIACEPCGNYVLLGYRGDFYNKVYFWNHDLNDIDSHHFNVLLINSNGFNDFLSSIQPNHYKFEPCKMESFFMNSNIIEFENYISNELEAFKRFRTSYGYSFALLSIKHEDLNKLRIILKNNAYNDNINELLVRAAFSNVDIVHCLLDFGADINYRNKDGYTPLMQSVKYRDEEIVQFLIESGARIDCVNNSNQTLADVARIFTNDAVKEILTAYGIKDID